MSYLSLGELKNIFVKELLKFSLLFFNVTADAVVDVVVVVVAADAVFGEI